MRRLAALLAALFVHLRLLVFLAAVAAVVWVAVTLPPLREKGGNAATALVPKGSPALRAERLSAERFAFPLLTRTIVVVRDPHGLPAPRQAALLALAARLSLHDLVGYRQIAGAIALPNSIGAPPFTHARGTTAILYLYFQPSVSSSESTRLARRLVSRVIGHRQGEYEGVTGGMPAQVAQSRLIEGNLGWVELATLLVVALVVALRFRAVGAAALTIGAVIGAYLVSERLVALFGRTGGITLPAEMGPVLVVLVMGVTTDYSIFFVSRFRMLLQQGSDPREAARTVVRQITPIVIAAGVTVAAGTASLLVASLRFLHDFGPGLAAAVLVAMLTASVLVPAGLAVGGRRLFWPHAARSARGEEGARGVEATDDMAEAQATGSSGEAQAAGSWGEAQAAEGTRGVEREGLPRAAERSRAGAPRFSPARLAARHPIFGLLIAVVLVLAGASGLRQTAVGNELVQGLPQRSEPRLAYAQAERGFTSGVLAPTVLLVGERRIGDLRAQLMRLQALLEAQRGVALVLGPRQQQLPVRLGLAAGRLGLAPTRLRLAPTRLRLAVSKDGNLARYLLFLTSDPLGARGLSRLRALQGRLPRLLADAGLAHARPLLGGDSALSVDIVDATLTDLGRVMPVMLLAIFAILAIYLRALVAPAYLVLTSLLAVFSALGLTVYVMQDLLRYGQITYYVIFTVAVLLVSLGSDYNVFLIGRIWQQGRRRPLRAAVEVAGARAARPIALAGIVLAAAFALLAIVPLRAFREIAFAMTVGLLIDAFIVRAILVPALVSLVGPRSAWPRTLSGERSGPSDAREAPGALR